MSKRCDTAFLWHPRRHNIDFGSGLKSNNKLNKVTRKVFDDHTVFNILSVENIRGSKIPGTDYFQKVCEMLSLIHLCNYEVHAFFSLQ